MAHHEDRLATGVIGDMEESIRSLSEATAHVDSRLRIVEHDRGQVRVVHDAVEPTFGLTLEASHHPLRELLVGRGVTELGHELREREHVPGPVEERESGAERSAKRGRHEAVNLVPGFARQVTQLLGLVVTFSRDDVLEEPALAVGGMPHEQNLRRGHGHTLLEVYTSV